MRLSTGVNSSKHNDFHGKGQRLGTNNISITSIKTSLRWVAAKINLYHCHMYPTCKS